MNWQQAIQIFNLCTFCFVILAIIGNAIFIGIEYPKIRKFISKEENEFKEDINEISKILDDHKHDIKFIREKVSLL